MSKPREVRGRTYIKSSDLDVLMLALTDCVMASADWREPKMFPARERLLLRFRAIKRQRDAARDKMARRPMPI